MQFFLITKLIVIFFGKIVEVLLIVGSVGITWSSPLSHAAKSTKNVGEPIQEPNKSIQFESTIIKTIAAPLSPSPVMDSASIDSTPDVAKTEGKNSRIRNVRQARSHDHDHDSSDVSPSHLTYSNLPHSFYLQPNERPEMVGMFPVIRDLQPIVPWSFPYGSLPYKFNHCKFTI